MHYKNKKPFPENQIILLRNKETDRDPSTVTSSANSWIFINLHAQILTSNDSLL